MMTSITRRRRALAPIQVLTDIERTKANLEGDFWHHYDLFNIALAVIDQVALAMGISAGRTWDETLDYARSAVAAACHGVVMVIARPYYRWARRVHTAMSG